MSVSVFTLVDGCHGFREHREQVENYCSLGPYLFFAFQQVRLLAVACWPGLYSGKSNRPPDPNTSEKYRDTPISIEIPWQTYASSWLKGVYIVQNNNLCHDAAPICMAMLFRSIRSGVVGTPRTGYAPLQALCGNCAGSRESATACLSSATLKEKSVGR